MPHLWLPITKYELGLERDGMLLAGSEPQERDFDIPAHKGQLSKLK